MNKIIRLACLAVLLGGLMPAAAVPDEAVDQTSFAFGLETFQFTYREPDIMKETGSLKGIFASFTYGHELQFIGEARYSQGQMDYEGGTWGGTPLSISDIDDTLREIRILIRSRIEPLKKPEQPVDPCFLIYTGAGYRYLIDDLPTGSGGYQRESNYIYLPLGFGLTKKLAPKWSLQTMLEYDFFIRGVQKSDLSEADPGFPDVDNDQFRGFGYRASALVESDLLWFELFLVYWKMNESKEQDLTYYGAPTGFVVVEPKNNSREVGLRLGIRF